MSLSLPRDCGWPNWTPMICDSSLISDPRAAPLELDSLSRWHLTTAPWITEQNKIAFSSTTDLSEESCLAKTHKQIQLLTGLFWELTAHLLFSLHLEEVSVSSRLSEAWMRPCSAYLSMSPSVSILSWCLLISVCFSSPFPWFLSLWYELFFSYSNLLPYWLIQWQLQLSYSGVLCF